MAYTGQAATGAWGAGVSSETLGMRVGIGGGGCGQTGSGQALKASSAHVIRLSIFVPCRMLAWCISLLRLP